MIRFLLLMAALLAASCLQAAGPAQPAKPAAPPVIPFIVTMPDVALTEIVLQYDPAAKTGADWAKAGALQWHSSGPEVTLLRSAQFLQEGIKKMTGKELPVKSTNDLSRGIVLTTLANAPAEVRNDGNIQWALRNTGKDHYNANEAFYVRSEKDRVLVIGNTPEGVLNGAVALLESVDYEILGMGPDWIYAPDYTKKPLVFALRQTGRPGYYNRGLWATSGQSYGVGTLMAVSDPADEPVDASYRRWQIGSRQFTSSMPGFPGHALQAYHNAVALKMIELKSTEGFLTKKTTVAPAAQRPAAGPENAWELWIDTEPNAQGQAQAWISDGKTWNAQNPYEYGAGLDLSVPHVRQIVFADMKAKAEQSFRDHPDGVVIFGAEPEDGGGYNDLKTLMRYQHWYPDYRQAEGDPLGVKPYVLHGKFGLDQPKEGYDPTLASDMVYGNANWLLREFDKWIDALPAALRATATGKAKKELIRVSLYSYNYHDVPPSFNLDPRIRVMIASYPKHRGMGKWAKLQSQLDLAKAYQTMLPREPSGDYRIYSLSYYNDPGPSNIPPAWSNSAQWVRDEFAGTYNAGIKAMSIETDFNFARYGLGYYLISKMLWNPAMTAKELDQIRDRWFQKAYGSAWQEVKAYYDFMNPEHYPVNGPNTWAKAIRMIEKAQRKQSTVKEPEAQRRLDDLKQYWYYHYLEESGQATKDSKAYREFAWKGQMSYMVAQHAIMRRTFGVNDPKEAAPEFSTGPARYTHDETQAWWAKVLDFWPLKKVTSFSDVTLANRQPAKSVDLNDLVRVKELDGGPADTPFLWNSGYMKLVPFTTVVGAKGEEIGFKLWWPFNPNDGYYRAREVPYGVDIWNPAAKKWESWIDETMTKCQSVEVKKADGNSIQLAEVRLKAPRPGTYRFSVGRGGNLSQLASLDVDVLSGRYDTCRPFSYYTNAEGLTQSAVYLYIPKGTKSVDLEVWDTYGHKFLTLYTGLPSAGLKESRKVDIGKMGTHAITLNPGEDGTVAMISGNGFAFPYLYSLPTLWAKSPRALLVPRGIAKADGLTIE
ncbi:MAG: beta-N-acetylhexosaminidase family protein [Armatimonadota bacterium]